MTFYEFRKRFPDDDACLHHVMLMRCGGGSDPKSPFLLDCPKCRRASKFHRSRGRPSYACQWCGHHIHPLVGTPMERTHTHLHKWFYAMFLFAMSRPGVAAKELQRQLGGSYKTAWRMAHKIRAYLAELEPGKDGFAGSLSLTGEIEIDETYVGGKRRGPRGRGAFGKTIVFGMLERGGAVRTRIVPNVRRHTLEPIITDNVRQGSKVYTDELGSYDRLGQVGYVHETVEHGRWEFARGDTHVNSLEGFWARLKLSIRGTHVWVSGKHLRAYAHEFAWRYNHRHCPEQMFEELVRKVQHTRLAPVSIP